MLGFRNRLLGFVILMTLVALVFAGRLFQLQILEGEKYAQFSQANSLRRIRVVAPRGTLMDRHGRILAENRPNFVLTLQRSQIKNLDEAITDLSEILGWEPAWVREKLKKSKIQDYFLPQVVATELTPDEVARIRGKISRMETNSGTERDLSGIHLELRYDRIYPAGEELGHLLGYVREASTRDLQEWEKKDPGRVGPGGKVGIKGVEKSLDDALRGHDGFRVAMVNALGKEIDLEEWGLEDFLQDIPIVPGQNIRLTIDEELNRVAYEAFGDKVGALVALDPRNGEILAWVSKPSYHPSQLSGVISQSLWESLRDHPDNILLNRPLQAAYPPGSTQKIVTAIAALAEGEIDFKEKIRCNGFIESGGRKWGCWNRHGHGPLNLKEALTHSCDVFFYRLGQRLGPDRLAKYGRLLGLGQKTHVLADSERSGLLPTSEWKQKNKKEPWVSSDNLGNAIGQGYNLVTPLQNALMIAQVANGGKKIHPHFVLGQKSAPPKKIPWGLTPEQWRYVRDALVDVVESPGGTAKGARVSGVKVGGKTGTAQVVSLGREGGGKTKDHAWFVAFAPAEHPEIALAVVVEHGGSGGRSAAPIAQKVLQKFFETRVGSYLQVRPGPKGATPPADH